jgi:hypothetical protein
MRAICNCLRLVGSGTLLQKIGYRRFRIANTLKNMCFCDRKNSTEICRMENRRIGNIQMKKNRIIFICFVFAVAISGCTTSAIKPNYTSTNMDLMRIGGEKPVDEQPEIINMGSYCLQVTQKWKMNGKTPDGQAIWSKDTLRATIPCQ